MYSLLRAAKQLGSEEAKFLAIRESVKLFRINKGNLSSLQGRELERGVNLINSDCATWCAMTDDGENLLKITCHSEDNNILSPKNLLKELQEELSLNAQDDESDFYIETFLSRPNGERRNFLANVNELRNFREGCNLRTLSRICSVRRSSLTTATSHKERGVRFRNTNMI